MRLLIKRIHDWRVSSHSYADRYHLNSGFCGLPRPGLSSSHLGGTCILLLAVSVTLAQASKLRDVFCGTRSSAPRLLDLDSGGAVETEEFLRLGVVGESQKIANYWGTDRIGLGFRSSIGVSHEHVSASIGQALKTHLSVVSLWQIASDLTETRDREADQSFACSKEKPSLADLWV